MSCDQTVKSCLQMLDNQFGRQVFITARVFRRVYAVYNDKLGKYHGIGELILTKNIFVKFIQFFSSFKAVAGDVSLPVHSLLEEDWTAGKSPENPGIDRVVHLDEARGYR